MRKLAFVIALALIAPLLAPRESAARGGARKLFERGNRALAARRYVEALWLFLRVSKLTRRRSVTLNVAQAYRLLEMPDRALHYYRRYLRSSRRPRRLPYYRDVRRFVSRSRRVTALVRAAESALRNNNCRGALRGLRSALALSTWARVHELMARCQAKLGQRRAARRSASAALARYRAFSRDWLAAGARRSAMPSRQRIAAAIRVLRPLTRKSVAQPPPPPKKMTAGSVRLEGIPAGATLHVDGTRRRGPVVALAAGMHEIVVADGARRWRASVRIRAGVELTRVVRFTEGVSKRRTGWLVAAITLVSLAAAAEAVGIIFAVKANDLFTDDPDFGGFRAVSLAGHIGAASLGVVAGVSLAIYLLAPRSSRASSGSARLAPRLLPLVSTSRSGGLVVGGTWRF